MYYLYEDQTNWNKDQLYSVYRYIYRMIDRRNTTYGSLNGSIRMNEIDSLDLSKMSKFTKICLFTAIKNHNADYLFEKENLKELQSIEPLKYPILINSDKFMPMDKFLYQYGIINGLRKDNVMANGFLSIVNFKNNLEELNKMIDKLIKDGKKDTNFVFEIKCIGGFAMLYHAIRDNGLTEDMDSLVKIDEQVKKCIKIISLKNNLPHDWINDEKNFTGMDQNDFTWELTDIKLSHINVYVCSIENLLVTKIGLAENHFNGQEEYSERKYDIDYQDTILILKRIGIELGVSNPGYIIYRLKSIGIDINDYPNMRKILIYNDDPIDNLIWGTILKCEDSNKMQELEYVVQEMQMELPDLVNAYGNESLSYFPHVYAYIMNKIIDGKIE